MPVEVIMPKVDMDMDHGTVAQWHKQEGENVAKGEALFDIETDKATMEVESPATGTLRQITAAAGEQIAIGSCIAQIYADGEALLNEEATDKHTDTTTQTNAANATASKDTLAKTTTVTPGSKRNGDVRASPSARRVARENQVNLAEVVGTGPRGRITRDDVDQHLASMQTLPGKAVDTLSATVSTAQLDALGIGYSTLPVSRMRTAIARRLTESKSSVPHFYLEQDCRVDKLQAFRRDLNAALADRDAGSVSLNHLIVQACARALLAVPQANVAWAGTHVVQYQHAAVAVAVSLDEGLLTPVLRNADQKSIETLAAELDALIDQARQGKLATHQLQGASMSVSNLGMFGVQRFKAIINPPESMILAVGTATPTPVVGEDGQITTANSMTVCLSCDHRVIDGAVAARWMQAFRRYIENPVQLLL